MKTNSTNEVRAIYCVDKENILGLTYKDSNNILRYDQPIKCAYDRAVFKSAVKDEVVIMGSNTAKAMNLNKLNCSFIIVVTEDDSLAQDLESVYDKVNCMSYEKTQEFIEDSITRVNIIGGAMLLNAFRPLVTNWLITEFDSYTDFYLEKLKRKGAREIKIIKVNKIDNIIKNDYLMVTEISRESFVDKDQYGYPIQGDIVEYVSINQ